MGYFAVRHEMKSLFWGFLLGCVAGCAYFAYKVRLREGDAELDVKQGADSGNDAHSSSSSTAID